MGRGLKSSGNTEFIASMSAERIVCHQLLCDSVRQRRVQPTTDVDGRQFAVFASAIFCEFGAFQIEFGMLGVRL